MAVPTISISGSVLTPSGDAPTSGRFTIKLSTAGSVTDTDTGAVVRVATEETVDLTAGAIAVSLVPNESITPTGTYYLVSAICVMPSGRRVQWSEKWQLAASPTTIDIGSVPRTDIQAGVAASHVGDWPAQAAAQVAAAAASAASAAAEAAAADSWASQSEASAAAAAVSALAASSISGIWADTTAGLAGTASGSYFYTVSTDPYVLILYLDNAGTAVEQGRVPAATAVQALQRALTPETTDAVDGHWYLCDSAGRVILYVDADSGLQLYGRDGESVQTRLAELDNLRAISSSPTSHFTVIDSLGRMVAYLDQAGGLQLVGRSESIQASVKRLEDLANSYDASGAAGPVVLPATGFVCGGRALRGEERYVWSGMPAALRPNQTTVVAYPFYWVPSDPTYDLVVPSMVRRRQGTINDAHHAEPFTWGAEETITVNAPTGFFDNADVSLRRQWRDGTYLYDRATGYWYFCDSGITDTAAGWRAVNVPIFRSSDGLAWDFVAYTPTLGDGESWRDRLWTPDWVVAPDGTLYVQVNAYVDALGSFKPWFYRCNDPGTFASWTDLGPVTGSALPVDGSGNISATDSCVFTRNGVWHIVWTQYTFSGGTPAHGRMGIAYSTSLLGPYDNGHYFTAPTGEEMKGEGICVIEMPQGGPYKWRLLWDNFLATTYGGITSPHMCADTNDFVTFSPVRPTGFDRTAATVYERNTNFVVGY